MLPIYLNPNKKKGDFCAITYKTNWEKCFTKNLHMNFLKFEINFEF